METAVSAARKPLILNGEMSEWLKVHAWNEAAEPHEAASTSVNAHAISDFAFSNYHAVRIRKPRCSSRF
jgi:hypothetical protein